MFLVACCFIKGKKTIEIPQKRADVPSNKNRPKPAFIYTCSGAVIFSSSLQECLYLSLYFLLQSFLPRSCDPGATPVRRIFERRNNPAVCQKVRGQRPIHNKDERSELLKKFV